MRGYAHCLYIEDEKWQKLTRWKRSEKKKYLTIIFKPHANPHAMNKTHAKFHNNRYKTKRSCAHKRYQLFMYKGWKWLSQCGKSDKKWSNNYTQITCTSSYHEENTCKVSKWSVQNCKRSCAHKTPRVNVDGWADGRTNVRKLARLSRPAKAGATKSYIITRMLRSNELIKILWRP